MSSTAGGTSGGSTGGTVLEQYGIIKTLALRQQSFGEYYTTLQGLADYLDGCEFYNANRPKHIPDGQRYRERVGAMKEFGVAADRGDTLHKEKRQAERNLSELDVESTVSYVRTFAIDRQDPTVLHGLPLPLTETHQKNTRKSPSSQEGEIHLELKRVKGKRGAIWVMGRHVRNGGPYTMNLSKGKPVSEESWYNPGGHYISCRKNEVSGLEPANEYWVRMRTDGPEGPGEWSQAVSIIVL